MEPTWYPGASIDRVDNDGPYSPENCRWATWVEQGRNKRSNHRLDHEGETLCISETAERAGIHPSLLSWRLRRGWTPPDLFLPANSVVIETELGPMTMREAVEYYEVHRETIRKRLDRGKTWRDGLLDPVTR